MRLRLWWCLPLVLVAVGCGGQSDQEITETRTVDTVQSSSGGASSEERFGMAPSPARAAGPAYTWKTPEGWTEKPATQFRIGSFAAGPNGDVDISLSEAMGSVADNLNRWRGQMGLAPLSGDEIAALEKKPILGQEAIFVNWEGTYSGMQGQGNTPKEGYRLAGYVLELEGHGVFVKMVGPSAEVEGELGRLDEFVQSVHHSHEAHGAADPHAGVDMGGDPHAGVNMGGDPHAGVNLNDPNLSMMASASEAQFTWTAPETWKETPARPMREVTFNTADEGVEVYVAALGGAAGGTLANVNRWRTQMGVNEPLTEEQLAALPKITMLGKECPFIEVPGTFTGMGGTAQPGYLLLGTLCEIDGQSVFVKMTGPEAAVKGEKDRFVAFCQSLAKKG